ncbi:MAG: glycosyltransferase [Hyphomicrobiales bacterium]|nr:glycosyltransferase [Hyphomicrobiales bacterium]
MPTRLEWTPRLISRFWNGIAQTGVLDAMSFAHLAGPALMEFLDNWIEPGARCLDYGGGSGQLLNLMVEAGYRTASFEPSVRRAGDIKALMAGKPEFLGVIPSYDRAGFDFVVCTEVIEHILPSDIDNFMRSMTRRVAPGGLLFLTTPFAENLVENDVYCPCCDHVFHRWQHQRSWQLGEVEGLMRRWGLTTEWLGRVGFDDPHYVRDFNLRRRCGEPWPWLDNSAKVPIIGRGDHIVYIGRKPNERPMSLSDPEHMISAGLSMVKATGATPIVVVPSSLDRIDAPVVIVANDLIEKARAEASHPDGADAVTAVEEGHARSDNGQGTMMVFPGSMDLLQRAVEEGHLPQTRAAFVFEDGWRRVRPLIGQDVRPSDFSEKRGRIWSLIEEHYPSAFQRFRDNQYARRIQPWLDERENEILPTLLSPGNFPYRLSHVVERRVLLGVSTLGSGGAERQMVNTLQGLRARGLDDVHMLVEYLHDAPQNAFYLDKALKVGAGVHVAPNVERGTSPWALQHPHFRDVLTDGLIGRILNAAAVIKKLAPEIVYTSLDWTNITVGVAAVLAGVPKVFMSGRNLAPTYFEFFQWFMYPCYRALAGHPSVRLLNNSDAGRSDYARWLKLDRDRITVLRNGLASEEFPVVDDLERRAARRSLGIDDASRVVVGAFRLSSEKRPLLWIEAAARIKARLPNAVFLLCGIGLMDAEVRARATALGLDSCIRYLGVRDDIQTVFSAADVVLQTALQEGTPNTLIEAQAVGIPVVTTAAFGAAEAVDDGVTGFVVRDETPGGLAKAALSILQAPAFGRAAREAGPKFVEARFGFERMINDTLLAFADAGVAWALEYLPEPLRHRAYLRIDAPAHDTGHAWIMPVPKLKPLGDDAEDPRRSRLVVLEDGKPLGPPHTSHEIVRSKGGGAFSHWEGRIYFSASDNTDPACNGREYVAIIPR